MNASDRYIITGSLTRELAKPESPVRRFFDDRFSPGLKAVQKTYRAAQPVLLVPSADRAEANPGTIGTAADWLLRFLMHPQPDIRLALAGAVHADQAGIGVLGGLLQVLDAVGIPEETVLARTGNAPGAHWGRFEGPAAGSTVAPEILHRACWAIALATEVFRAGPTAAARGPLGQFAGQQDVTGKDLLALAPPVGLDQLARFREVFADALLPRLTERRGLWALGPTFTGSALIDADADLITAGLLTDLKTSAAKFSLPVTELYQILGYALLDTDDEYALTHVGLFSARYAHLTTWPLPDLLRDLAEQEISVPNLRSEFRNLLLAHQP